MVLSPTVEFKKPALVLAPMEGVTDASMRALLSERGGFSFCVSEFLRISQTVLPARSYFEHIPELLTGSCTPSGTPVQLQLLGGNEGMLALSAMKACELGACAIDINFGCPAPTVNRHDGGAAILRYPHRIRSIVSEVRKAVPYSIPVSAKLRLGWDSPEDIFVNAAQAALGGASWLTIHARTKSQGYAPPAHWSYIGEVKRRLEIPVIANGEIWTFEDFLKCQEETGCEHFMLGRGALANPLLVHQIADQLGILMHNRISSNRKSDRESSRYEWKQEKKNWGPLLRRFAEISDPVSLGSQYTVRRIKQWLKFAGMKKPLPWFEEVKTVKNLDEMFLILET